MECKLFIKIIDCKYRILVWILIEHLKGLNVQCIMKGESKIPNKIISKMAG